MAQASPPRRRPGAPPGKLKPNRKPGHLCWAERVQLDPDDRDTWLYWSPSGELYFDESLTQPADGLVIVRLVDGARSSA
jgi:hypothetical protein